MGFVSKKGKGEGFQGLEDPAVRVQKGEGSPNLSEGVETSVCSLCIYLSVHSVRLTSHRCIYYRKSSYCKNGRL